jgi:hypothetical protein
MAQAKVTTDHDEIRKCAGARGGRPRCCAQDPFEGQCRDYRSARARRNPRQPSSRQKLTTGSYASYTNLLH